MAGLAFNSRCSGTGGQGWCASTWCSRRTCGGRARSSRSPSSSEHTSFNPTLFLLQFSLTSTKLVLCYGASDFRNYLLPYSSVWLDFGCLLWLDFRTPARATRSWLLWIFTVLLHLWTLVARLVVSPTAAHAWGSSCASVALHRASSSILTCK